LQTTQKYIKYTPHVLSVAANRGVHSVGEHAQNVPVVQIRRLGSEILYSF